MFRPLCMAFGSVALSIGTWSVSSLSPQQSPIIINQPGQGCEIVSATGHLSPSQVSGLRCQLRNGTSQEVVAYAVVWKITDASGVARTAVMGHDTVVIAANKRIQPGEVFEPKASGGLATTLDKPFVKVEVMLDYVEYGDGSSWGPNKTEMAEAVRNKRQAAKFLRSHLLKLHDEKGLDAALRELKQIADGGSYSGGASDGLESAKAVLHRRQAAWQLYSYLSKKSGEQAMDEVLQELRQN
jgi:hypothetical protein